AESCVHGPHHPAQKSRTTGAVFDRSMTSVVKVASVTPMTAARVLDPWLGGDVAANWSRGTAPEMRRLVGSMLMTTILPRDGRNPSVGLPYWKPCRASSRVC